MSTPKNKKINIGSAVVLVTALSGGVGPLPVEAKPLTAKEKAAQERDIADGFVAFGEGSALKAFESTNSNNNDNQNTYQNDNQNDNSNNSGIYNNYIPGISAYFNYASRQNTKAFQTSRPDQGKTLSPSYRQLQEKVIYTANAVEKYNYIRAGSWREGDCIEFIDIPYMHTEGRGSPDRSDLKIDKTYDNFGNNIGYVFTEVDQNPSNRSLNQSVVSYGRLEAAYSQKGNFSIDKSGAIILQGNAGQIVDMLDRGTNPNYINYYNSKLTNITKTFPIDKIKTLAIENPVNGRCVYEKNNNSVNIDKPGKNKPGNNKPDFNKPGKNNPDNNKPGKNNPVSNGIFR